MYQEFLAYWQSKESMARARISAPSLAVNSDVPWRLHASHPSALPYSFRHTLQRIKRKTHGRTRESSCCVRPFRGGQKRVVSKGFARMSLCTLPDLIKGPFATDGWLFAGDFVKDFCSRWPRDGARSRHRRLLVFLSLRGQAQPIYFRLCSYWSTKISFRLRVISTGAKQARLTYSPLRFRFRTIELRLLHTCNSIFHFFLFSETDERYVRYSRF